MPGHTCYHCTQFVEEGEEHDCWTTTEDALLEHASEELRDAYERLRDTAAAFGEQRIYASHHCIMFARKACYFFVRPKREYLELCVFLGRTITAPEIKKATPSSKTKTAHLIRLQHRDQVEPPITDWLREAYRLEDTIAAAPKPARRKTSTSTKTARKKKAARVKKTGQSKTKARARRASR